MKLDRLIPTPEQREAIDRMAGEFTRAAIQASELGTGKTLMAVELVRDLGAQTALVTGPLHTRESWEETVERQELGLPFRFINNSNKAGRAALEDMRAGVPGFYFAGREWFRLQDWSKTEVDFFCWDECHVISKKSSAGYKAINNNRGNQVLKRGYTLLQSATWFGSSFDGAYSVTRAAWPEFIDGSFARWKDQWCAQAYDHFAFDKLKVVGEKNPGAYAAWLPCYVRIEGDIEVPREESVYVEMSAAEKRQYAEMEKESIAWLQENPLVPKIPAEKYTRLRQLALGVAETKQVWRNKINKDTGEREDYLGDKVYYADDTESSTIDTLKQILDDLGDEKVLITTDFSSFGEVAAKRIGAFAWLGSESDDTARGEAKKQFIEGDLQYILAHPAAIAEGTDGLQRVCHIMINITETADPVLERQLKGRLARTGQTKQVTIINMRRRGTEDDKRAVTQLRKQVAINQSVAVEEVEEVAFS